MPVVDLQEARDLDHAIESIVTTSDFSTAVQRLRAMFVELLDFDPVSGSIPLRDSNLPQAATRIGQREGVQVVAVVFPEQGRVAAAKIRKALAEVRRVLAGDVFLVATEATRAEWHFVYPAQQGSRETLRRMIVYRGQPRRTVAQQLASVFHEAKQSDLREALERAFDVEAVTKTFFREYKRIFGLVMELVTEGLPDKEERKLFCQTLFNRLMFLYFLQRKGWLTFNGDPEYLEALWREGKRDRNLYDSRLKLLFFSALSNERSSDYERVSATWEPLIGRVPFLNGGLFDKGKLDDRPGVVVPNEAIRLVLEELFARFNFTIAESTPYDVQVAVDPEMLGKVFEELVTGRHETGSYYTPRPIVAFMCREALKGHLASRAPEFSKEAITAFVDDHDVTYLTVRQAARVLDALEQITVLDPACGSGAYLLGMLYELIELQRLIYSSDLIRDAKDLYDLKLQAIERSIYGVDIDPFAVNVTMLRLWLSLIIDYDGLGDPPALPNLAFKIVCGDSLLAPNPHEGADLFRARLHERAMELERLKGEFMRETGRRKLALQQQIDKSESELRRWLSWSSAPDTSVDWRIQFAEVFDRSGGFDTVLANPPYVRQELIRPIKSRLKDVYGSALYTLVSAN